MINFLLHRSFNLRTKKTRLLIKPVLNSIFSPNNNKNVQHKLSIFNLKIIKTCVIFMEHFLIRNKYVNLVSKQTTKLLYKKHFVDSLTILSIFHSQWPSFDKRLCLDIGTGGGFPGLILAIFFPQIFFCLLDSVKKKIEFHKKMVFELNLENCQPLCVRVEFLSIIRDPSLKYNFILTRAVSEISILLNLTKMLLASSGKLVMMKGIKNINQELYQSLPIIYNEKSSFKSIYTTSILKDGKIILIFKK